MDWPKLVKRGFFQLALLVLVCLSISIPVLHLVMQKSDLAVRTEKFIGPFAVESPGTRALQLHLDLGGTKPFFIELDGDKPSSPYQSSTTLFANGFALGPPHAQHQDIRDGKLLGAYSHWGSSIIFNLPDSIENSAATTVTATYRLSLKSQWLELSPALLLVAVLLFRRAVKVDATESYERTAILFCVGYFLLLKLGVAIAAIGCLAILLTTLLGYVSGYALPTTAIFEYGELVKQIALYEPTLPHLLIAVAFVGFTVSSTTKSLSAAKQIVVAGEQWVELAFKWLGLPVLLALFIFVLAAMWSGLPRSPDYLFGASILGLVPFSDAADHFASTFYQASNGDWGPFGSRRPMASALRAVMMGAVGYSLPNFLLLQASVLAGALYLATRAATKFWGPWAGLTFLGLAMISIRPYLGTTLTEPLGLTLSLLSIPMLLLAFNRNSFGAKVVFLFLSSSALMVRMGNMFFIPLVAGWAALGKNARPQQSRIVKSALVAIALLALVAMNGALSQLYSSKQGSVGGNFSLTLCGLTHGGDWTMCPRIYHDDFATHRGVGAGNEAFTSSYYYQKAVEKLKGSPEIFFLRLFESAKEFTRTIPAIVLRGYSNYLGATGFPETVWFWLSLALVGARLFKVAGKSERSFWGLFVMSLIVSSSVVYFDDGLRVLSASYPVLALLFASGYSTNGYPNRIEFAWRGYTARSIKIYSSLVALVIVAMFIIPWVAHTTDQLALRELVHLQSRGTSECQAEPNGCAVYLIRPSSAAFVVLPDSEPLSKIVPTVHWSDFRRVMALTGIEQYGRLGPSASPAEPFMVGYAIGMNERRDPLSKILIAPPSLLVESTGSWFLSLKGENPYWRDVVRMEPIKVPAQ